MKLEVFADDEATALAEVRRGRAESGKFLRPAEQEVLSLQSRRLKNGM